MESENKITAERSSRVPHLVVSRQSSTLSDASLSQGEFERMININFPQVLAATDDIGFESMRSDATSITSTGLSTLYLQAKSTSTPSIPAALSLSESTKKAINNLERCLQDIGPESGIGISPADFGDSNSAANNQPISNNLLVPSVSGVNENKWSLNSSLEVGDDVETDENICQPSVYTTPDNRVERQLYSLDGNRRSSFESVYSPPIVTEQVVNEMVHVCPSKATVLLQDERPHVRPVKEVNPPPRLGQKIDATFPPATSVTTSISEIISSPQTETTASIQDREDILKREYEEDEGDGEDGSTSRSAATLGKKGALLNVDQSERSDVKPERRGVIATAVAVPIPGELQKIVPKPRIQNIVARPRQMEPESDYEWAKKVQEIAQWQADVNLAMQEGNHGTFIASPVDSVDEEISEARRPKPLRRRCVQQVEHQQILSNGNKLENMQRLLQPYHDNTYEGSRRDDMFTRRFNGTANLPARFPKPQCLLPTSSQNGPEFSRSNRYQHFNGSSVKIDFSPNTQIQPKVNMTVSYPGLKGRKFPTSYPSNHISGYAEALSLATAANAAVAEAFNRRDSHEARPRSGQGAIVRETTI